MLPNGANAGIRGVRVRETGLQPQDWCLRGDEVLRLAERALQDDRRADCPRERGHEGTPSPAHHPPERDHHTRGESVLCDGARALWRPQELHQPQRPPQRGAGQGVLQPHRPGRAEDAQRRPRPSGPQVREPLDRLQVQDKDSRLWMRQEANWSQEVAHHHGKLRLRSARAVPRGLLRREEVGRLEHGSGPLRHDFGKAAFQRWRCDGKASQRENEASFFSSSRQSDRRLRGPGEETASVRPEQKAVFG